MSSPEQTRALIEALHNQSLYREQLLEVICGLAGRLDKDIVVETLSKIIQLTPVESENRVVFGSLVVRFDANDKAESVYLSEDGENPVGRVVIQSDSKTSGAT